MRRTLIAAALLLQAFGSPAPAADVQAASARGTAERTMAQNARVVLPAPPPGEPAPPPPSVRDLRGQARPSR